MPKANLRALSPLQTALNQDGEGDNSNECLACGICNSRCTWYDGQGGPNPRQMARMAQLGLDDLLAKSHMLWDCMACNHCTVDCPVGIHMDRIVRKARALPQAREVMPIDIGKGVKTRLEVGDVNGFTKEDFFETIEWLNEEIAEDNNDPKALIPVNQKGARYLYLPNPRELGLNLLHLQAMARMFYAFGEPWTMSSRHTDVTNWGYFIGDDEVARTMALQIIEAAEALDIEVLVLSECGHAYIVMKRMAERLIGRKPKFTVLSMPELTEEMAANGAITLDPNRYPEPVAYHDPCNIARKGGQFEAPRKLLARVCKEVVELSPNRMHAICCGGGGGLLQDSSSTARRMISGKPKADQIRSAGVKHLATACLSCHRQLDELSKHYKLGVQVHTVVAMAEEALVIKKG
jgi:Fe-S oxidoreductase